MAASYVSDERLASKNICIGRVTGVVMGNFLVRERGD
jgi:hypothetical protein